VILVILAAIALGGLSIAQGQNTTISGVVKSASGEPVAGAFVKVWHTGSGPSFMVVSQAQGRYQTPSLPPGKYTVQAIGGDRQSDPPATVEVARGQHANKDLALSRARKMPPPRVKILEADFEKQLPEGDAKKLLTGRCVFCHGVDRVIESRYSREEWESIVDNMRSYMEDHKIPLSDAEKAVIMDYLTANFGPNSPRLSSSGGTEPGPHDNLHTTLVSGPEAKYVAMDFALTKRAGPHDITVDSRGIAWVSERVGMIGRWDPETMAYTRIPLPAGKNKESGLNAIAADPRDVLWAMENGPNNRLIQYNARSGEFNTYDIPAPPNSGGSAINTLRFQDAVVWGSGITSSRIIKLDTVSRKVTEYPVPKGTHPYGLAIGGDKMIWYVANYGDEIVRLDPGTGNLTHYKVPPTLPRGPAGSDIRRMQADHEGNLWAGESATSKLLKIDYRTGRMTQYVTPTPDSGPYSIDIDPRRNIIWFSEWLADKVARFDPQTGKFQEFPVAAANADIRRIEVDRENPNRVWWSGSGSDRIGYIEVFE
jgi:virginiamycin B lyase